jgi:hypothetical protein
MLFYFLTKPLLMKKKESGLKSLSFRWLIVVMTILSAGFFTQCKKDEEEVPKPSAPSSQAASPSAPDSDAGGGASASPDNTVAPYDPSAGDPSAQPQPDNSGQVPAQGEAPSAQTPADQASGNTNSGIPVNSGSPATSTPPASGSANGIYEYTIKASESIVDGQALNLAPGAVVKLESGTRGALLLKNFKGSRGTPITIVNGAGNTVISSGGSYGLKVENSQYFRITGTGSGGRKGLVIDGGHIGLTLDRLSSDFEVDQIEVKNNGFAGIMAKTDPACDKSTWRGNFVMQNLKFHDNYLHDMKGEGFYIGNSFYAEGKSTDCGVVLPHEIMNVEVFNNTVNNSGCEGIQAGCVVSGLRIFNNKVTNFGTSPFANAQDNGIQIGEGSSGQLYNNLVQNGPGNGIIVLGKGNTTVYNNLVINAGSYGAFIDNRGPSSGDIAFLNNTFVGPKKGGIKTFNEMVTNKFYNNIITGTGSFFEYGQSARGDEKNNLTQSDIESVKFVNASSGDYRLKAESPAVNKGLNAGINSDYEYKSRPAGGTCDIGAFESM